VHCRQRRVPYKRIAAELGKSELACRLHFHQVTVARQRSSPPMTDPIPAIEFDLTPPLVHRSSSPNTPALSQDLLKPAPVHPLPSISSMLPLDIGHHRRSKSLPPLPGHPCVCGFCPPNDLDRKAMLPPPTTRLLSPFEPARQPSCYLAHDVGHSLSPTSGFSYRLPTPATSLASSPECGHWTPGSSRSSSISSFTSIAPSYGSPGCGNHLIGHDRCSLQSIMNQNIPSTI
jgi:hypothetical protein